LSKELKLNLQKQKKTGKSNQSFIQMFDVLNIEKGFFHIQRLHYLLSQDVVLLMVAKLGKLIKPFLKWNCRNWKSFQNKLKLAKV
jgi:hypothetical protein